MSRFHTKCNKSRTWEIKIIVYMNVKICIQMYIITSVVLSGSGYVINFWTPGWCGSKCNLRTLVMKFMSTSCPYKKYLSARSRCKQPSGESFPFWSGHCCGQCGILFRWRQYPFGGLASRMVSTLVTAVGGKRCPSGWGVFPVLIGSLLRMCGTVWLVTIRSLTDGPWSNH